MSQFLFPPYTQAVLKEVIFCIRNELQGDGFRFGVDRKKVFIFQRELTSELPFSARSATVNSFQAKSLN
jgi:hypothetical protein